MEFELAEGQIWLTKGKGTVMLIESREGRFRDGNLVATEFLARVFYMRYGSPSGYGRELHELNRVWFTSRGEILGGYFNAWDLRTFLGDTDTNISVRQLEQIVVPMIDSLLLGSTVCPMNVTELTEGNHAN